VHGADLEDPFTVAGIWSQDDVVVRVAQAPRLPAQDRPPDLERVIKILDGVVVETVLGLENGSISGGGG